MVKICHDQTGEWYGENLPPPYLPMNKAKMNAKAVANYCFNLSKHNWKKESVMAICGNMFSESHLNPRQYEDGIKRPPNTPGKGYGLVQWTKMQNLIDRAKKIKQYKTYDTMFTQLQVIDYEADHGLQWIKTSAYPLTFKEFMENEGDHSLEYLVGAWLKNYERPRDQSQSVIEYRTQMAREVTDKINWDKITHNAIDDFLEWCKKIADNNEYIYHLGANHMSPPNWDSTLKEFDCSSFMSFGLHNGGGYDLDEVFATGTAKDELVSIGFKAIPYKKSKLKRGDVLVRTGSPYGHTEAVWSVNGDEVKTIGAHDHYPTHPDDDISIVTLTSPYEWILRSDDAVSSKPRENPTNSNKSSRAKNPKTPSANTQNTLPPTFLKRRRRF